MNFELKQNTRVILLLVDIGLLCVFSKLAFETWLPPSGNQGFWFYIALLSLLLGSRLITPFYTKPADVIAYGISALIALFLVNKWEHWGLDERMLFSIIVGYCVLISAAAFIQIFSKDSNRSWLQHISNNIRIAIDVLGRPRIIYSLVVWFAIYVFHRNSPNELFWIAAAWAVIVAFSPLEGLLKLAKKLRYQWRPDSLPSVVGEVVAYQNPNIVLFRQTPSVNIPFSTPLLVTDQHSSRRVSIALDYVGRDEGILRRAVDIEATAPSGIMSTNVDALPDGVAVQIELDDVQCSDKRSRAILQELDTLVGVVSSESSIERLYFEVLKEEGLEEGRLVETFIRERPVIYQIVNGLTKEEVVYQKNSYGYVRAQAQKIGTWKPNDKHFALAKWLPSLNSPVFLKKEEDCVIDVEAIGHFPRTSYSAHIKSIPELVSHNTAILGILGIGKSFLAFELVERVLSQNIKVICLDLTDEYAEQLEEYCYDYSGDELYAELAKLTGPEGKAKVSKHVEEGGNKLAFAHALDAYLERFIQNDLGNNLIVFNPSQYEVWRQDSKPFQNEASMVSLSPTEITQLFTESALKACHKLGKVEKGAARVCLVYEEAHSLIPEWNTVVNEGDKAAVNGTARAILQGRKFGLGCILVTQRTANVTKTILNQCNTIFAMRTFDDTGKEFLSNYIGKDYANVLPSLEERHAVFFGKASKCENPILIRLNDRVAFLESFRAKYPAPEHKAEKTNRDNAGAVPAEPANNEENFDNDIPF